VHVFFLARAAFLVEEFHFYLNSNGFPVAWSEFLAWPRDQRQRAVDRMERKIRRENKQMSGQ
jgi:hypothetical protein